MLLKAESVSSLYAVPAHKVFCDLKDRMQLRRPYILAMRSEAPKGSTIVQRGDIFMRLTLSVLRADSRRQMWPLERNKNAGNLLVKRNERPSSRRRKKIALPRTVTWGRLGEFGHAWKKSGVSKKGVKRDNETQGNQCLLVCAMSLKMCVATSRIVPFNPTTFGETDNYRKSCILRNMTKTSSHGR